VSYYPAPYYTHEQYLAGYATVPFIINGVLIKPRVRVKMGRIAEKE
jgi:hypothetical protein